MFKSYQIYNLGKGVRYGQTFADGCGACYPIQCDADNHSQLGQEREDRPGEGRVARAPATAVFWRATGAGCPTRRVNVRPPGGTSAERPDTTPTKRSNRSIP